MTISDTVILHPIWCKTINDPRWYSGGQAAPAEEHHQHLSEGLRLDCGQTFDWTIEVCAEQTFEFHPSYEGGRSDYDSTIRVSVQNNHQIGTGEYACLSPVEARRLIEMIEHQINLLSLDADRGPR